MRRITKQEMIISGIGLALASIVAAVGYVTLGFIFLVLTIMALVLDKEME